MKIWNRTEAAAIFWKKSNNSQATTVVDDGKPPQKETVTAANVRNILERCNITLVTNEELPLYQLPESLYSLVASITSDIVNNAIPMEVGMMKLLEMSMKDVSHYQKKLLKGIVSILQFLPKKAIPGSLGESELWSTYHMPLLQALFSDTQQNVLLRWSKKAVENLNTMRPDAVITNKEGLCLGFGECKLDCNTQKLLSFGTINKYNKDNVFSFQIVGFQIIFFVISLKVS